VHPMETRPLFTLHSFQALAAGDRVLARLEALEAGEQLAAMGWATVVVLGALRFRFKQTPEDRTAFDLLCSETQAWLRREIEALRFTKAH